MNKTYKRIIRDRRPELDTPEQVCQNDDWIDEDLFIDDEPEPKNSCKIIYLWW